MPMSIDAASIMTRDVLSVGPDTTIKDAAARLSDRGVSAAPVVDGDGHLLGMVSEGDLMQPFGRQRALRRAWWLNVLAEGEQLAPEFRDYLRLDTRRVRDVMTKDVVTVGESADVSEIADLLTKHRIKRVPVVREGKLVGVVSRADLVRALARSPDAFAEPL
jgi:CBS domain-containing protein